MNEVELQAKIDEAKAAGYTDEQIQAYLNPQAPAATKEQPWVDRSEEKTGTVQTGLVEAGKTALEVGGGYMAAKKAINMLGDKFGRQPMPEAPAAPVQPEAPRVQVPQNAGGGPRPQITPQQTFEALGKNYGPAQQAVQPPAAPEGVPGRAPAPGPAAAPQAPPVSPAAAQGETFIQRMSTLAKQYGPMAGRVATGVGAMLYSPELNAGEDAWVAEQRRRQGRR